MEMSTDMAGLFSTFEIFTRNAGTANDITYSMLEQLDAAPGPKTEQHRILKGGRIT